MPERTVLTINTGSSSLKAAVFDAGDLRDRHLTAQVEHIGHESALTVTDGAGNEIANEPLAARITPMRWPPCSSGSAGRVRSSHWWPSGTGWSTAAGNFPRRT